MRVAEKVELDGQVERELRGLSKRRRVQARVQQRASVVLLAAKGWQNKDIATEVSTTPSPSRARRASSVVRSK